MRGGAALSLASFEDAFAHALFAAPEAADAAVADLVAQPAFAVYRNTVTKSCIDALQANFPTVARLVGEAWFRAAAAEYVSNERPSTPSLQAYGATFAAFLADFAPAAGLPYLAGVARLDRFWIESHGAVDAPVLGAADLVGVDPDVLAAAVLLPHPAARWAWFDETPVYSIWRDNRARETHGGELRWRGEGALLTRRADVVEWTQIDHAACRFLDECAAGRNVALAIDAALDVVADANPALVVATLLDAGAFTRLVVPNDRPA
jgi:Putative DNA-binding domain